MKQKIYLITSENNRSLAQEILQGNTYHITQMRNLALRHDSDPKLIIALIDYKPSFYLLKELQYAVGLSRSSEEIVIIPIIINGATVPACLKDHLYMTVDTSSNDDMKRIRKEINEFIQNNPYKDNSIVNGIKKRDVNSQLMIITTIAVSFTTIISAILATMEEDLLMQDEFNVVFLSLIIATLSLFTVTYANFQNKRKRQEHEKESKEYSRRLVDAISIDGKLNRTDTDEDQGVKAEIDAIGRMLINLEDIKEFYTWSQKQAKAAFALAISMCCVGLVLIITATIISVAANYPNSISIIVGLGGVVIEVVAGTALVVYRSSLSQLNHYHQALHEDERFLSSASLIDRFSNDSSRDEMLKEIIRSEIQMNLNTLQNLCNKTEQK